jgi:tetratricopeptide (TPR) repeat protein
VSAQASDFDRKACAPTYRGEYADPVIRACSKVLQEQSGLPRKAIADVYANRGSAYLAGGDVDAAIADFDEAIELDLEEATAYYLRGITYYRKGDFDRAIADFDEALRLDPNHSSAREGREAALEEKD